MVTTLGSAGASYRGPAGELATARPPRSIAIDTTGAGDAFTGAFAVAWAEGVDPAAALTRACAAGALATTSAGAGGVRPEPARTSTGTSPQPGRRPARWTE